MLTRTFQDEVDKMTGEDCIAAWERIRERRSLIDERAKWMFKVGQMVKWTGKRGLKVGKVIKINRARLSVQVSPEETWKVPPSMLSAVGKEEQVEAR
jgi:hypothetical protein